MFERFRVIHFVGIGGIGMSGIAEVLHNLGYVVTGSDVRESGTTRRLRTLGVKVSIGHSPGNVGDAHVLVVSSAIVPDNTEVLEARSRLIPVIPRAEMLAELARLKYGILVAGAHGKTTTTSLVSAVLASAGFDPTIVIGGRLKATGSNARIGQGEFLVAEADESDGSFLKLSPTIAVVTNIDKEHMDFFKEMDSLRNAFLSFVNKVPFYGAAIVCTENQHIRELLPLIHRKYLTYGIDTDAELYAANISAGFMSVRFEAVHQGVSLGLFSLPFPGVHNVLNCLAAIGVALVLKIDIQTVIEALDSFGGVQRRLEFKGEANGVQVYDDYGHHPAEVRATLRALRESIDARRKQGYEGGARLIVLFQPHRYTRTRDLLEEFASSFADADSTVVLDIYPAGETQIEGVDSERLVEKIRSAGNERVLHIKDREAAAGYIASHSAKGDLVLTLGAGDVWKMGEEVLKRIGGNDVFQKTGETQ
jgi:UDP-N-acetylmuramate--alanine ligase